MSETGKAYEEAQLAEIGYADAAFGFWAKNAEKYLADERVRSASPFVKGRKLIVRYVPLGVVGVIGPWNYPLTNSFGDCIPAMVAGNSVMLKPSEVTPLTSLLMGECLRECGLPEDVYQVAARLRRDRRQALIDEVDFVMFTGSTATGKKVMERAARTLTPVSLELGGKDPMIVCADAPWSAPRTRRSTTRCRTQASPAPPPSASTSRSRSTTTSSPRGREGRQAAPERARRARLASTSAP